MSRRIEIKLSLKIVAPLLDLIKTVARELKDELAVQLPPAIVESADDADMSALWRESLLASQNEDAATLLALFDDAFFATGVIAFGSKSSGRIIRACSALRLRMRARMLAKITDETLEQGVAGIESLPEETQRALMAYMFLATMQELIIRHFETTIIEGPEN